MENKLSLTPNRYCSYLLRLWAAGGDDAPVVWRASLENPHTGERLTFASLERLFAFLEDQCSQSDTRKNQPGRPVEK